MFPEALATADDLDSHLARTGQTIGSLHGLPISLKDNFHVKGHDSTVGLVARAHQPDQDDSTLVGILRRLGAVVYVKTNVPTAMLSADTVNNVFGRYLPAFYLPAFYLPALSQERGRERGHRRLLTLAGH